MKAKYMAAIHAALFTLASLFAAQLLAASEKSPAAGFMASAPAGMALGAGMAPEGCVDCHATGYVDWTDDPFNGGQRVSSGLSGSTNGPIRLD